MLPSNRRAEHQPYSNTLTALLPASNPTKTNQVTPASTNQARGHARRGNTSSGENSPKVRRMHEEKLKK